MRSRSQVLVRLTALAVSIPFADVSSQTMSYVGSVQFTTGDYGLSRTTTSVAFLNGVAVRADHLRAWLSVPLILQNAGWVQYGGAGMLPSGGLPSHGSGGQQMMSGGGMMSG